MENPQLKQGLERLFQTESQRIVFWHDPDREFEDTLPSLEGVELLRLDRIGALEAKILLERQRPQDRFLLYAPFPEPEPEQDWLLDIRLYSRTFRADRASMLLDELGLPQQHLRSHLAQRLKFLASRERLIRLKRLVTADDDAQALDRKMMAVVVRSEAAEFFPILAALFQDLAQADDLHRPPPLWEELEKYALTDSFWQLAELSFGYGEDQPSLLRLLIRLLMTDLDRHLSAPLPPAFQHLPLARSATANTVVCLAQWRDSSSRGRSYERLSGWVAHHLRLDDHLAGLAAEELADVFTFQEIDKTIIRELRDRLVQAPAVVRAEPLRNLVRRRQDGYWASTALPPSSEAPRQTFHAVYSALISAAEFLELRNDYPDGFARPSAEDLWQSYRQELYRFDQLYRSFCEWADQAQEAGWDVLKTLRERMESAYGVDFLARLARDWDQTLGEGLLKRWRLDQVTNQYQFFDWHVRRTLDKGDNRIFVIISDAFRYEAAVELTDQLNSRYRLQAELTAQLGVLPSYTGLGMAALLPHQALTFRDNGEVLVDGQPAASLEQRGKILDAWNGVAIKAGDFIAMKKEDGRAFIKPYRLIYIYHDVVDAVGDKAATEERTFSAVRQAIDELAALVRHIVNSLNGNRIVITADHGFLFRETPPGPADRSGAGDKPPGTVKAKKRYLLGRHLPEDERVWQGSTTVTAGTRHDGMHFWVPRGVSRFHFVGGARFVHGGASLQEIMVPVLTVRQAKGSALDRTRTRHVAVQVLGSGHKITTNRHRFQFIQTEAVSERVRPVTLTIGLYDQEQPISNVETVTFDSTSTDLNTRSRWLSLSLQGGHYDKKKAYHLVLRNLETGAEEARIPVTIDLAFSDDFF